MNIEKQMIKNLREAPLEQILDREDIDKVEWFWINRDIFEDILKNIPTFDYYQEEEKIRSILRGMEDEDFIAILKSEIEKRGFLEISQQLFAKLDEDYRVMEDIKTWIFIKDSYYNRLWIKKFRELEWILRAMSIDAYQRLDFPYSTLQETYRELFENNNRIMEEILNKRQYVLESGKWILSESDTVLIFYKKGKVFYKWGEGEVDFKFDELQLS